MKDDEHEKAHTITFYSLKCIEERIAKVESRMWGIVILLFTNLLGVIGILVNALIA